jgi:chaperone required for assembly of F1-ATPase
MKRFYEHVSVAPAEGGFAVLLDGRPVQTPAKNRLALPTSALAEVIAEEWRGQGEEIKPVSMPFLRLADTVIDGIIANPAPVVDAVMRFADNDLLCYRADTPQLAARQAAGWDPMLDWAARRHGADLAVADGLNHIDQPAEALEKLRARVAGFGAYELAALHVAASITGSLVLALALAEGEITPVRAFELSRIDEAFQAETWSQDHEAQVRAAALAREIDVAAAFMTAARDSQ